MPNFIFFAASTAELAHRENRVLTHSLTHPAYLMPREPKRTAHSINKLLSKPEYGTEICFVNDHQN